MIFLTALTKDLELARDSGTSSDDLYLDKSDITPLLKAENTLAVLCCIEEIDSFQDVKEAASRVFTIFNSIENQADNVSLIPFGHLSNIASNDVDHITTLLDKMKRTLVNKGVNVSMVEPGSANVFIGHIVLLDRLNTVRLGTTEKVLKNTLSALIRSFGIKKVFKVLGQLLD